jgi:ankyrin repeat protein
MLLSAVRENNFQKVFLLLKSGEDACQVNGYKRTALHKAAYYASDPEILRLLIFYGADINALDKGNWSPLHLAARNGHFYTVKILVAEGSNMNCQDLKHGWTPLHSAIIAGHTRVAKLLIGLQARIDVKDISGSCAGDYLKAEIS